MSLVIFPVFRSRHTAPSSLPSGVAVVSQIWSSQATGEDHALPWIAVFQATFSVSLHRTGRPVAFACPSPVAPRNSDQFCAIAAPEKPKAREATTTNESAGCLDIERSLSHDLEPGAGSAF